jgi:CubicO group peptidase (beta-lactamase class C family)
MSILMKGSGRFAWAMGAALIVASAVAGGAAKDFCTNAPVVADPAFAADVDAIVDAAIGAGFAGGVAIVQNGALAYLRVGGFSDRRNRVPVTGETLFHVASMTKYLTAIAVLRLVENGKVALDDPLEKYFPGLALGARGATIADLLAHRAGLGSLRRRGVRRPSGGGRTTPRRPTARRVRSPYSNDGYDLLGIVIERATGDNESVARRSSSSEPASNMPASGAKSIFVIRQPSDSRCRRFRASWRGAITACSAQPDS